MPTKHTQNSITKLKIKSIICHILFSILILPTADETTQFIIYGHVRNHWIGHNYAPSIYLFMAAFICAGFSMHYLKIVLRYKKENNGLNLKNKDQLSN